MSDPTNAELVALIEEIRLDIVHHSFLGNLHDKSLVAIRNRLASLSNNSTVSRTLAAATSDWSLAENSNCLKGVRACKRPECLVCNEVTPQVDTASLTPTNAQTKLSHQDWQRKLIGAVEHAVKFMRVCGYQNFEKHEPEYQMWKSLTDSEQRGFECGASQQPMDAGDWKTVRDCIDHAINEDTGTPNEDRCLPAADAFYRIYAEHIAQRGKAETEILLPIEMPGCKIVFEECPVGHGELRATNWVKNECPWCKIKILESALSDNGKADVVPSGDAMELAKKCVKRLVDLYGHKDIEVIADYIQSAFNARDAAARAEGERIGFERAQQWRDISTAPKDGSDFLLYSEEYGVKIAHYQLADCGFYSIDDYIPSPTHWTPLPASTSPTSKPEEK